MTPLVWLIGNTGMLGHEVAQELTKRNVLHVATGHDHDIADFECVRDMMSNYHPKWIVNCSAYTAVDKAEDEPELAYRTNATGVENIGRAASTTSTSVIHISTDYVFDGEKGSPYTEEDSTNPLGVYGLSKAEGEERLRRATERHFIIRTAWLFGRRGKNFVATMYRLLKERDLIRVVDDQVGSPTYAADLAKLIVSVVERTSVDYGTYHFANAGQTTWYDFACLIRAELSAAGLISGSCRVEPISTEQYPTKAKRPPYSVLSTEKIRAHFSFECRALKSALNEYITALSSESD